MRLLFANKLEYWVKYFLTYISLSCRIASYIIELVTTENPESSYLTSTEDKTHHGPVIALFYVQLHQSFLAMPEES